MTIQERADKVVYKPLDGERVTRKEVIAYAKGYELGAHEQQVIDIEKACDVFEDWILQNDEFAVGHYELTQTEIKMFRESLIESLNKK